MCLPIHPGILAAAVLLTGISLCGPKAHADVVFVTNETDQVYGDLGGTLTGEAISIGATPFYLTSVSAEILGTYVNASATLSLYARNTDGTLGSLLANSVSSLYTLTSTTTKKIGPYPNGLLTATFSDYLMQPAISYWLVMTTPGFSTKSTWEWAYTGSPTVGPSTAVTVNDGVTLPSSDNSFYQYKGATTYYPLSDGPLILQVNGVLSVPEPATFTLLGAGVAGLGVVRRRKNV